MNTKSIGAFDRKHKQASAPQGAAAISRRQALLGLGVSGAGLGWRLQAADLPRSPITNRWGTAKTSAPPTERFLVFRGRKGAGYNHHQQVISVGERLYATWSSGLLHEDDPGQRMMMAVSEDRGETWSEPVHIAPPLPNKTAVQTSAGIRVYKGKLYAYYGYHEWTPLGLDKDGHRLQEACYIYRSVPDKSVHRNVRTEARVSSDGGRTWSTPKTAIPNFVPNMRPFDTARGRLIIPGQVMYPHTDDPEGLTGWKRRGLPRIPEWTVDDSEGFHKACAVRGDTIDYCEGSFFQTDDSSIYMMLRTAAAIHRTPLAGWLAVTVSRDNGETWSEPQRTDFTDCSSRFQFGRLPDGRYFGLSCPDPKGKRTPMILATSKNGVQFDRHYVLGDEAATPPRIDGRNKGGAYGYPSLEIAHGNLYAIYSTGKEDISVSRVALKNLA